MITMNKVCAREYDPQAKQINTSHYKKTDDVITNESETNAFLPFPPPVYFVACYTRPGRQVYTIRVWTNTKGQALQKYFQDPSCFSSDNTREHRNWKCSNYVYSTTQTSGGTFIMIDRCDFS